MTTILIGLAFVVVGTVAYVALRNARDFSDANQVLPGVDTGAPRQWAGAHSAEARLHRRIRDAMTALRANASLDGPDLIGVREALEREAVAVDQRLVAVAALARRHKDAQLPTVAEAVERIEGAVADVVAMRGPASSEVEAGLSRVRTRLALVEQARRELEGLGGDPDGLGRLRAGLEAMGGEPLPSPGPPAAPPPGPPTSLPTGPPVAPPATPPPPGATSTPAPQGPQAGDDDIDARERAEIARLRAEFDAAVSAGEGAADAPDAEQADAEQTDADPAGSTGEGDDPGPRRPDPG